MPRQRFGVVLLVPAPWATEINGLRRACGDRQIDRVPPHITLVPPINVRADDVPTALALLRAAGASRSRLGPLDLTLGPPASFHPDTDKVEFAALYLRVGAEAAPLAAVQALRAAVFLPPLARVLEWPFVPHVTLSAEADRSRTKAALDALVGYEVTVTFDRIHLLEEQRGRTGRRVWVPVADAPFETPAVVGRGGIEIELTGSLLVDPEAAAFEDREQDLLDEPRPPVRTPAGATPIVFTARHRGDVVGVVRGWSREGEREIQSLLVGAAHRRQGISRQLRLAFAAARVADDEDGGHPF